MRFGITGFLLIAMVGVVVKMSLRHALQHQVHPRDALD